jgi:hypothetical protein
LKSAASIAPLMMNSGVGFIRDKAYDEDPEGRGEDLLDGLAVIDEVRIFLYDTFNLIGQGNENVLQFLLLGRRVLFAYETVGKNRLHGVRGLLENFSLNSKRCTSCCTSASREWPF